MKKSTSIIMTVLITGMALTGFSHYRAQAEEEIIVNDTTVRENSIVREVVVKEELPAVEAIIEDIVKDAPPMPAVVRPETMVKQPVVVVGPEVEVETVVEKEAIVETPTVVIAPKAQVMDMPAVSSSKNAVASDSDDMQFTHPIMRLTPDKSQLVRLDSNAASVIVGNPNHISVMLDTPNTLVVVPRAQGASHFSVLGENGTVIMQRHVIVGAQKEKYVRIRRSCGGDDRNCEQESVYFCPDMCHEVSQTQQRQR